MFAEFTMAKSPLFSDCFGFTEQEVESIYTKYLESCLDPQVAREGLRTVSYTHLEVYKRQADGSVGACNQNEYHHMIYFAQHLVDLCLLYTTRGEEETGTEAGCPAQCRRILQS